MTSSDFKSEVLPGPERRRRRTPAEKLAIVAETQEPGVTISLVARRQRLTSCSFGGGLKQGRTTFIEGLSHFDVAEGRSLKGTTV